MLIDILFGILDIIVVLFLAFVATLLAILAVDIFKMSTVEFAQQPKGLLKVIKGKGLIFNLRTRKIERL